jgi:hypothetical protein
MAAAKFFDVCFQKFTRFLQIQLFITLISLPILSSWGISLSFLTIIGNLIFAPVLSIFLLVSSLVMFCQLLHIPHQPLIYILNTISAYWLSMLHYAPKECLFTLPQPPVWWCCIVPLCALLCVTHTKTYLQSIFALIVVAIGFCGYLKIVHTPSYAYITIPCSKKEVHAVLANGKLCIIDPGSTSCLSSPTTWVDYTLMQELAKKFGSITIDHYVLLKPSIRSLLVAQHVTTYGQVKNVYVPYWPASDKKLAKQFIALKLACEQQKSMLHRLGKKLLSINLNNTTTITIKHQNNTHLEAQITKNNDIRAIISITKNRYF